jgi:hypothetical protein
MPVDWNSQTKNIILQDISLDLPQQSPPKQKLETISPVQYKNLAVDDDEEAFFEIV